MFEIEPPRSTEALRAELTSLRREITESLNDLSTGEFLAAQGKYWSPAEHIRHLATAVKAVARGMAMPRFVLAMRFGIAFRSSRSFEQVRSQYQAALASGPKVSGAYDPAACKIDMEPEKLRQFVMQRWAKTGHELDSVVGLWKEKALDRYRARHPLLGMMTIRELLYFTLYHNAHHARRVRERRHNT